MILKIHIINTVRLYDINIRGIEISFRELKYAIGLNILYSKKAGSFSGKYMFASFFIIFVSTSSRYKNSKER